jgi:chemotaxis protein CheD
MSYIYVGIGEYAVSKDIGQVIKTMALGSCVSVILYDSKSKAAGLIHIALPDSSINQKRAENKPGSFADTGIPAMLNEMKRVGWDGRSRLVVKLAGGASIMDPNNTFNIGKRNILATKKILWGYRLGAIAEDIGGTISRTVSLKVEDGTCLISSPGRGEWEL